MTLSIRFRSANLSIPIPPAPDWKTHGKPTEAHAFVRSDRPPIPVLQHVFLKRYRKKKAPAHDFLLPLLGTDHIGYSFPLFLGYCAIKNDHYYAFQALSSCPLLSSNTNNRKAQHNKTLSADLLFGILYDAMSAFHFIERFGFYYPDFSFENMLVNYRESRIFLIDMDSCFPLSVTAKASDCRQTFWTLFSHEKIHDLRYLNHTMILSMSIVLFQALTALRQATGNANVAQILRAHPQQQQDLFIALKKRNTSKLSKAFHLSLVHRRALSRLSSHWNHLIARMKQGQPVCWDDILEFCIQLFNLNSKKTAFTLIS